MCVFPSTLENCVVVLYFHFRYISYNFLAYLTNVTDSCLCECIFEQSDMHLRLPQIFIFCLEGGESRNSFCMRADKVFNSVHLQNIQQRCCQNERGWAALTTQKRGRGKKEQKEVEGT